MLAVSSAIFNPPRGLLHFFSAYTGIKLSVILSQFPRYNCRKDNHHLPFFLFFFPSSLLRPFPLFILHLDWEGLQVFS